MTRLANEDIEAAREAAARREWAAAYDGFRRVDEAALGAEDLAALADAAWWMGEQDASLAARTRAYTAFAAAGDEPGAGFQAGLLAIEHFQRAEPAVGAGWLQRARRHVEGLEERPEHGFLAGLEATVARYGGDLERAMKLATTAAEIGRRTGDADVWILGLHTQGLVHLAAGRIEAGLPLLDEAMTSVVAGQLSDFFTGVVYCNVVDACLQIADVARAGQWSDAARAWCESIPEESPYPGLCRVNRAQVADLRGAWSEAHAEAERASRELLRFDPYSAGLAHYEAGEIRRRLGDIAGAEEAFRRARELGFDPEPGHALLRLAEGKATGALSSLRLAAQDEGLSPLRRARVLAATVEAAIATGDPETARSVSAELDALAEGHGTPALSAVALATAGRVAL
ncbi:MAG TPA: LuxR family transcriptional regulator, partial [Actinomycetota bacterium]|nr:LuxR family transcriptional regulator [Actinomycetota bacterium]